MLPVIYVGVRHAASNPHKMHSPRPERDDYQVQGLQTRKDEITPNQSGTLSCVLGGRHPLGRRMLHCHHRGLYYRE